MTTTILCGSALVAVLLLCTVGIAAADDYVGGIPLTTVTTGTVTGDLWMDLAPAPNWGVKDVTKTFTLPAAAVAAPGRIKWARLYISAYCAHMQSDYAFTMTTKFDGDGASGYEQTWPETAHEGFVYVVDGGNDNSEFAGHGAGEPYLMLNDHETRITSDYFATYDVTNLISSQAVTVNVNTVGSYDGRVKVMSLVVAYDDPASTTETRYWVNQGHDVCSYYTEQNFGTVALGTTTFATAGITGATSARLSIDYMASNNGYYGFPTAGNTFGVNGETGAVEGSWDHPLDRIPDVQGAYSGADSWDATAAVNAGSDVTFGYARYFPGTGTAAFYKLPLAVLVVKKPLPATAPVAAFSANDTTPDVGQTVIFTDASTHTPTSWSWTIEGTIGTDYQYINATSATSQNPHVKFLKAGTYDVSLIATNAGGSDTETKTGYITVTAAPTYADLGVTRLEINPGSASGHAVISANEVNTLRATVANTGTLGAGAFDVTTTIGSFTQTLNVASLAGGATTTVDFTYTPTATGTISIVTTVDSGSVIAESDEANNTLTTPQTVYYNGYKGKRYTAGGDFTTTATFTGHGDVVYSTGTAAYLGTNWNSYSASFTAAPTGAHLSIPSGATIVSAWLYQSTNFDQTTGPGAFWTATFNGGTVTPEATYTDRKGYGSYDYPSEVYVYDVTGTFNKAGTNTWSLSSGTTLNVALYPAYMVVVYEDASATEKTIVINDECDILYSRAAYNTNNEEATAYAPFTGVDTTGMAGAKAVAFVAAVNEDGQSQFIFNGVDYDDFFIDATASTSQTVSIRAFPLTNVVPGTNEARFQSRDATDGDNMQAQTVILVVERTGTVPIVQVPGGSGVPRDMNSDGKYEDVNGNGRKDFADVVLYFNQMSWIAANEPIAAFDFNANGRIDFADVVWLFNHL